jgi:hypothetical protein
MRKCCIVCDEPWNRDAGSHYFTLKTTPEGAQEEILVCQNCKPNVGLVDALFTRVQPYIGREQQPPFWRNDQPLRSKQALDPSQMPLDTYPLIEDFEVLVEEHQSGYYSARLISPSRGYLTHVLNIDLSQLDFIPPSGSITHPHTLDAGWDTLFTLIAEDDEFVYILTDNEDFRLDDYGKRIYFYYAWFRVEKGRYYHQWKQAFSLVRMLSAAQKQQSQPSS